MSQRPFTSTTPPASVTQPAAPQPEPLVTDGEWGVFPATPQPQPDPPPPEPPTPPVRRRLASDGSDAVVIGILVMLPYALWVVATARTEGFTTLEAVVWGLLVWPVGPIVGWLVWRFPWLQRPRLTLVAVAILSVWLLWMFGR